MKLFIDTANVDEIRAAAELGVICGVTTNPSLIAREGKVFEEVIKEITTIVDGPISAEVVAPDANGMVAEAKELAKIHKNIVIKIPMTLEGLKATKQLSALGIKTENPLEKIHFAMDIIQTFSHEYVFDKHDYIDYFVMRDMVTNTIVSMLKS